MFPRAMTLLIASFEALKSKYLRGLSWLDLSYSQAQQSSRKT